MKHTAFRCPLEKAAFCPYAASHHRIKPDVDGEIHCPVHDPNCRNDLIPEPEGRPIRNMLLAAGSVAAVLVIVFLTFPRSPKEKEQSTFIVTERTTATVPAPKKASETSSHQEPQTRSIPAREVLVRVAAPDWLSQDLLPPLATGYLKQLGAQEVSSQDGMFVGHAKGGTPPFAVQVVSTSTDVDLELLAERSADVVISTREPTETEIKRLQPLGDFSSESSDAFRKLLARDGFAVLTHSTNEVPSLTTDQIIGILEGTITDWSQVGGQQRPIHRHLPRTTTGFAIELRNTIQQLGRSGTLAESSLGEQYDKPADIVLGVARDPAGFGITPLRHADRNLTRVIPVAASTTTQRIHPSPFTIGTEDYGLHRRIILYHSPSPQSVPVLEFIKYALSVAGQREIGDAGFVDLDLHPQQRELPALYRALIPPELRQRLGKTEQLPVNFRFATDSFELDFAARDAIERVVTLLAKPDSRKKNVLLFGFTDGEGSDEYNFKLSVQRAQTVSSSLQERGITQAHSLGLGKQLPVATNDTPAGRDQNRRVEIWLAETQ